MISEPLLLDGIRHKFPFFVIGHQSHQPDLFPRRIFRPEVLWYLSLIIPDHFIGHVEYALGASVVLFQLHHLHIIIVFLELKNILDRSAAETVDALRVIAHHADIFMCGAQQFDDLILRRVGILVLVDQDVFELMLEFVQAFREMSSTVRTS